jgi:hypothetical protein
MCLSNEEKEEDKRCGQKRIALYHCFPSLVWFGLVVMADDDEIDLGEVRASYW